MGGGYVLNPRSNFPLTVFCDEKSDVEKLKSILDKDNEIGRYESTLMLVPLIARSNLRCKEIDDYVREYRPKYLAKIEKLKQKSPEWEQAGVRDKEDLLPEFKEAAVQSLHVRPFCDVATLFESEPQDPSFDDALLDRFGYDCLRVYLRHADNLSKVRVVPTDHYERKDFEKLVTVGLAIRGSDIELSDILQILKLKEMNELLAGLDQKPFGRKAKAIEYLLQLPDLKKRMGRLIAYRELFQLRPLPEEFAGVDLNEVSKSWKYAEEVVELIRHTYIMAGYAGQRESLYSGHDSFITGWELSPILDSRTCQLCNDAAEKTYPA
jgi:hypothetical protein